MTSTLQKMTDAEMLELAEKLVGMKIDKARGYTRRLDPDSKLEMLRVGFGHELLTRIRLPGLGISVTLVEIPAEQPFVEANQAAAFVNRKKFEPEFVEARVQPLA